MGSRNQASEAGPLRRGESLAPRCGRRRSATDPLPLGVLAFALLRCVQMFGYANALVAVMRAARNAGDRSHGS